MIKKTRAVLWFSFFAHLQALCYQTFFAPLRKLYERRLLFIVFA